MSRSTSRLLSAAALALATALPACETVPGTGRSQLIMVPASMDLSLGAEGYQQTLAEAQLITSGPDYEMVQRVGQRVSEAAERLYTERSIDFEWEIVLIDEPETVNAWCMPGGKMAVYSGLLPVTQDEDGLAIVVGHEVAHAVARHGAERMSHDILAGVALGAASVSMSDMDEGEKDTILQALVGVGTLGVVLPFSRSQESEADQLGLYISADAGYDPRASIGLWQRMAENSQGAPPEFLSTHPSDETRIEHLQSVMPDAMGYYEAALERQD
ncbi:MAG TPA: M48 family metallopeptidase [Planctomycetota bacterium]|nr:M48 family metallopeptidase [Planctomycetota bacterium]